MGHSVPASADEEAGEINLTPMLDVVFIMLIFFIVTAVFIREPGVDVMRPQATMPEAPPSTAAYVAITRDNEIWLGGEIVETEWLRPMFERLRAENPGGGLVIQADADARNEYSMAVMDAARAAGFPSVVIAATSN